MTWSIGLLFVMAQPVHGPVEAGKGLVVCVDPIAARIGVEVLEKGGTAIDAAIAVAFALAVVHPEAGNIGGGGFLLAWHADTQRSFVVDYRETAPQLATPEMFLDARGNVDPDKVEIGWLTVGVPGTVHGLWTAHQNGGRLPWSELVEPSIELAERGFPVDQVLADSLAAQQDDFKRMGEPARVYFGESGNPPRKGDLLVLAEFARTLARIRDLGPDGFYRGPTADAIERAMLANGGLVRATDLAEYEAKVREAVRGTYRGVEILSTGPPSSGGVVLLEALNILEGFDLRAKGQSAATAHPMVEAMRCAFRDRAMYLGDSDFVAMPLDLLLSKEHAATWRTTMGVRAGSSAEIGADILSENESTTHFSIVDGQGNAVSNTYTLEGSYGAKVIAPGTGFLLNNEMHDFNVKPGHTDSNGLIGTEPNRIAPGKRMLSSQTPSIVLQDGRPLLVLGSPGGRTIPNTVLQVIVHVIDHDMPIQQAIDAPRLHHQWMPDAIFVEKGFPAEIQKDLAARGHKIRQRESQGDCHAIWIDPKTGRRHAGVDRRIRGAAFQE